MKTAPFIALIFVVLLTAGSAVVAGRLSNRWGAAPAAKQAAKRLLEMPKNIGEWELRQELELNQAAQNLLECEAYLHRRYEHSGTNDVVAIAVLLGPPGPIAVHTPEVCYSSREYAIKEHRERVEFAGGEGQALWLTQFQSKTVDAQLLQVAYGWSDGGVWQAHEDARWPHLGKSHLYKVQIAAMSGDANRKPKEVCNEFLKEFLPVMSQHLVAATRN